MVLVPFSTKINDSETSGVVFLSKPKQYFCPKISTTFLFREEQFSGRYLGKKSVRKVVRVGNCSVEKWNRVGSRVDNFWVFKWVISDFRVG